MPPTRALLVAALALLPSASLPAGALAEAPPSVLLVSAPPSLAGCLAAVLREGEGGRPHALALPGHLRVETAHPARLLARLAQCPGAQATEDARVTAEADPAKGEALPIDPLVGEQWALRAIRALEAWHVEAGAPDLLVAVIDTGVDYTHPDLDPRVWRGPVGERGFNLVARTDDPMDDNGHGTGVAGALAGERGNAHGIAGLARVTILPVKVLDAQGNGNASAVGDGVVRAVEAGAVVINLSLGTWSDSPYLRAAIEHALSKGVVVVAAAGNQGEVRPRYPAAYPGVIAVGATDAANAPLPTTNRGDWVDLAAPGFRLVTTAPGGVFACATGTSFAAPLVAGAAALLRSADGALSAEEIAARLSESARDIAEPGKDDRTGHGLLDAAAALGARASPISSAQVVADGAVPGAANAYALSATCAPTP